MVKEKSSTAIMQQAGEPSDPCVMVIFGASGDLTKRKLLPALYNLAREKLLSKNFAIVGISRSEMSHEAFRDKITDDIKEYSEGEIDSDIWGWFRERLYYLAGDADDPATYEKLKTLVAEIDSEHGTRGDYFYYLATAPRFFSTVTQRLGQAGLVTESDENWRRVIFEKPFGRDLDSARQLNRDSSRGSRRAPDLSHRPLPWQGDGPEYFNFPICQRNFRADLEPPLHRPLANHRRRIDRRRAARRILRPLRRDARHGAQSHFPAHLVDRDGAAHLVRR